MKTYESVVLRLFTMLLACLAITACSGLAGQASFKPIGVPLKVSIDTDGHIGFATEQDVQIPTPLGTFQVGLVADATNYFSVQNTLIVRVDGKDHIYDLHGQDFSLVFDSEHYWRVRITKNGTNLLLDAMPKKYVTIKTITLPFHTPLDQPIVISDLNLTLTDSQLQAGYPLPDGGTVKWENRRQRIVVVQKLQ